MALTLYLLRHADTLDKTNSQTDLERQLSAKGIKEAEGVATFLKERKIELDLLVCSHASRAQQTAQIIASKIELPASKLQLDRDIYHSNIDAIVEIIRGLPSTSLHILLVGHNPTISALANSLSLQSVSHFSTATIACFIFEVENWKDIRSKGGQLVFIKSP